MHIYSFFFFFLQFEFVLLCFCFVLFCFFFLLIFQADTNLILHIFLIIMIIMPCSGMFRDVPECSMFLILSTPLAKRLNSTFASGGKKIRNHFPISRASYLKHSQVIKSPNVYFTATPFT